jgi:hypothetical protein
MRVRRATFVGFAALLSLASIPARADDDGLTETDAHRLLAEAASVEDPAAFQVLGRLCASASRDEILRESASLPYVVLTMLPGRASAAEWTPSADLQFEPGATYDDFARALNGLTSLADARHPAGSLTLLHPKYFQGGASRHVDADWVRGDLEFHAPGVYRGRVLFVAHRRDGVWAIEGFEFPTSKARIVRTRRGRWQFVPPPRTEPPWPAAIALPVVAGASPLPPSARTITVTISPAEGVFVDGKPVGRIDDLRDALVARASALPREPDGSSTADLVVGADVKTPWAIVQWTLQAGSDWHAMLYRIHFAVTHRGSGERGVISQRLPKDVDRGYRPWVPTVPGPLQLVLFGREAGDPTTPEALYTAAKRDVAATPDREAVIDARAAPGGDRIPYGFVVHALDALRRAGVHHIQFTGATPAPKGETIPQSMTRLLAAPVRGPIVKIRGVVVRPDASDLPIPDGPAPSAQVARHDVPDLPPSSDRGPEEEELPPTPEETEQVHSTDVVAKEPTVKDPDAMPDDAPAARRGVKAPDRVEDALRWLAAHQSADGGWEAAGFDQWCDGKPAAGPKPDGVGKASYDVGVTGLAILAFLGAGYTNRSEGPYGKVVSNGLRYLRNLQDAEGCFGSRATGHYVYNHAIAALALVEAYGMTGSAVYKSPAQKALDFIAVSRNPYLAWRYGVKPGDNDTSVTGWMTMALKSARMINAGEVLAGKPPLLQIDEDAFDGITSWLNKATDPDTGRVGYQLRGTGPARPVELVDKFPGDKSEAMTADGMLTRILLGEKPKTSDVIQKGATLLSELPPTWNSNDGSIDFYYWYFGTLAMFQVGGDLWKAWEAALKTAVVDHQRQDTDYCQYKGSWDPIDPWGPDGGRIYSTALMAMACEVWYRYDRVFGTK